MSLQTQVWVSELKQNPVPDHSFVSASTDMSEFVEHNKINLAEAGVEPQVFENYFSGNEDPLPLADIQDIAHEVVLNTYSTAQTRHRSLQDVELAYDKRSSVIQRHRISLERELGKRAAFAWTPSEENTFNKLMNIGADDSIVDAVIDMQLFYAQKDKNFNLNVCFTPEHLARIRKEDKKLYKEITSEKGADLYGFKIYSYSNTPLFTSAGVKKPLGAVKEATDKRSSFFWTSDEVFTCFGDVEMYATLRDSGVQADTLSFAQRALVGTIRANAPKYFGAII